MKIFFFAMWLLTTAILGQVVGDWRNTTHELEVCSRLLIATDRADQLLAEKPDEH